MTKDVVMQGSPSEVRVADDGRVALRFPAALKQDLWLSFATPDGLLTAALLATEDVATWTTVWQR